MEPLTFAVLTCSDAYAAEPTGDAAGPALVELGEAAGWKCVGYEVVANDRPGVSAALSDLADRRRAEIVLTTGGTGFGPRDLVPEATRDAAERLAPGIAEALRAASAQFSPHAMLSRGVAVIRGTSLIINLPGSEKAARESFGIIGKVLPRAVSMMRGEGHCKAE